MTTRRDLFKAGAAVAALAHFEVMAKTTGARVGAPDLAAIPMAARPWARWWWPGTDVYDEVLCEELRAIAAAGFGGVEIQPMLTRLPPADAATTARRLRFPKPSFFAHVRAAAVEARRLGMKIDLTFGSGWPFGGPAITPELAQLELVATERSFAGPGLLRTRLDVPRVQFRSALPAPPPPADDFPEGWTERLAARGKVIAVLAVRGDAPVPQPHRMPPPGPGIAAPGMLDPDATIDLTAFMGADGSLEWNAPAGNWQIFVFKQLPSAQRVHGAYDGTGLVMDHLKRAAFDAYAGWIGPPMLAGLRGLIGNTVRAIFCDSLELQPWLYWTDDLVDEFRRRRGYDLRPLLPFLRKPGAGQPFVGYAGPPLHDFAGGDQVRADYAQTVSELMIERFFTPLTEWAHAHGLKSRVQAHGGPESLIAGYTAADIAESENLFDNGRAEFLKMAPSAAHLAGHQLVSNESFGWLGGAGRTTPEKIKRTADQLIVGGVNQIIYHGIPYPYLRADGERWYPFGADFSDAWRPGVDFWPYLRPLNDYIGRLQDVAMRGKPIARVLVLHGGNNGGVAHEWLLPPPPEPALLQGLAKAGYAFDLIDEATLRTCTVSNGSIQSPGGARYGALVVDHAGPLDSALARQLERLADGRVAMIVLGALPGVLPTRPGRGKDALVLTGVRQINAPEEIPAALAAAGIAPDVRFADRALPFARWQMENGSAWLFTNPGEDDVRLKATIEGSGTAWRVSGWTGVAEAIAAERSGSIDLDVGLEPLASAVILITPGNLTVASISVPVLKAVSLDNRDWDVAVTPADRPATMLKLPELVDLGVIGTVKTFSGRATYRTIFNFAPPSGASKVLLDLGDVRDVAVVTINGTALPPLLLRPYRIDITQCLRAGTNELQVDVTNAPFNATLAKPQSPGLLSAMGVSSGAAIPAGMLGPVQLLIKDLR